MLYESSHALRVSPSAASLWESVGKSGFSATAPALARGSPGVKTAAKSNVRLVCVCEFASMCRYPMSAAQSRSKSPDRQ